MLSRRKKRKEKGKSERVHVRANCSGYLYVCWGKVVLIVGELCPSVGSGSIVCLSLQPMP